MKITTTQIKELIRKAEENALNKICTKFVVTGAETEELKCEAAQEVDRYFIWIILTLQKHGIEVELDK